MSTSIGEVSSLEGIVHAINPTTQESRTIEMGDPIFAGETIVTSADGAIFISLDNGETLTLGRHTQMLLDDDVFSTASIDVGTEAVTNDIAALQQAVLEGNFEDLEETAAGDIGALGAASEGGLQIARNAAEGEVSKLGGYNTTAHAQGISDVLVNHFGNLLQDEQDALESSQTIDEDNSLTIDAVGQSIGLSGDNLRVINVTQPTNGTVVINIDGTLTYTPKANFNGKDSFSYVVGDEFGGTSAATINVFVDAVNDAPIAVDDIVDIAINSSTDIDVLANDSDVDGDTLTVTEVSEAANGTVEINSDGTLRYTPLANFYGTDSFTYTITDENGEVSWATVYVDVTPVNDAPSAVAEHNFIAEDSIVTGTVSFSDTDGTATVAITPGNTQPEGLTLNANGSYTFDASSYDYLAEGVTEVITIPLTVTDNNGATTTTTLTLTITGSNDIAIIAGVDTGSITEDNAATLFTSGTLTITDTDAGEAEFNPETITGSYGDLIVGSAGGWSYSADNTQTAIQELGAGDTMTDTITVTSLDGTTHDVVITITGTNDVATIAGADTGSVSEDDGATLTTSGTLTITDVDAGEATFTAETITGSYGSIAIAADGTWTYSADNTQAAIQSLGETDTLIDTITVTSADGTSHDIVVTINGVNDAAVIGGDDTGAVTEDNAATLFTSGTLTITDTDAGEAEFNPETITGSYGDLIVGSAGGWSYSADNTQTAIQELGAGDTMTDTITVTSLDGTTHDVVITITGTNDVATIAGADTGSVSEDDGATLTTSGTLTITDVDAGEATFTAETITGSYGSIAIAADGTWTYSADNTQAAIQSLGETDTLIDTITVTSADGTSHDIVVTINGVNDAAVIGGDDAGAVTEGTALNLTSTGSLSITDIDLGESEFNPETITGTYGAVTIDSVGDWIYIANNEQTAIQSLGAGDTLTDTMTVTTLDGTTHDVVITITGTNNVAVISGLDTGTVTEDNAATLIVGGKLDVVDVDAGEAVFTAETAAGTYGSVAIDASGNWTYSADNTQTAIQQLGATDNLIDTITVTSIDGTSHEIFITINGTNDAAVIGGVDTSAVTEDAAATLFTNGSLTISDVDTGEAAFTPATVTGSYGTVTIDSVGDWSYSANNTQTAIQELGAGDTLTDTMTITSVDGTTHDIVITINGTNDVAVIGGTDTGSMTEDDAATLTTSGVLTVTDVDAGEAVFTAETAAGTYGSVAIDASGNWTYSADNTQTAIQQLGATDSLVDTITITSADGTTHDIVVTINGTNDAATVSSASVTLDETDAALSTSGTLTATDVDNADNTFVAQTNVAGTNGTFSIDASGAWIFTANSAFDSLNVGDNISETFNVTSVDGTTSTVTVQIDGTNDTATVSSASVALTETDVALSTSGTLTSTDVDNADNTFVAQTNVAGTNGTFSIDASGAWIFTANSAFDSLNVGDSVSETFNVTSVDGAASTVTVQIDGTNDAPTLTVQSTQTVDGNSNTTITYASADVDGTVTTTATALNGTVVVNVDGTISYSPNPDYNGTDTITITATDNDGATTIQTSAITVNDVSATSPTLNVSVGDVVIDTAFSDTTDYDLLNGNSTTYDLGSDNSSVNIIFTNFDSGGGMMDQPDEATIELYDSLGALVGTQVVVLGDLDGSGGITISSGTDFSSVKVVCTNSSFTVSEVSTDLPYVVDTAFSDTTDYDLLNGNSTTYDLGSDNSSVNIIFTNFDSGGGMMDQPDEATIELYDSLGALVGTQVVVLGDLDGSGGITISSGTDFSSVKVVCTNSSFTVSEVFTDNQSVSYEYNVTLNAGLTDIDGSETLSDITIASLPSKVILVDSNGTQIVANVDGSYTVAIDTNGDATARLFSSRELTSSDINGISASITSTELNGGDTSTQTTNVQISTIVYDEIAISDAAGDINGNLLDNVYMGSTLDSIVYNGTTYNAADYTGGLTLPTLSGGSLALDFSTGTYTYTGGGADETFTVNATNSQSNAVSFTFETNDTAVDSFLYGDDLEAEQFNIETGHDTTIVDFDYANDVLDLSEVITGPVDAATLGNYLDFTFGGTDTDGDGNMDVTSIAVDADGDAGTTNDITVINIQDSQFDIDNIDDLKIDFQDN
ncbi:MAG: hypothetical protein ISEC1_P0369 [Thiomicrorhabdus sp.]|nr:MAG: hypothetical protein ISEC1_P0369 [Thiomicrorhabdus sp.]